MRRIKAILGGMVPEWTEATANAPVAVGAREGSNVGGRLPVSPDTDPNAIEATQSAGLVSILSTMTLTEPLAALATGWAHTMRFSHEWYL